MRSRRFRRLLAWRQTVVGTRDADVLEICLTVEGLPADAVPPAYAFDLRAWRKLSKIRRSTIVRSFVWRMNAMGRIARRR